MILQRLFEQRLILQQEKNLPMFLLGGKIKLHLQKSLLLKAYPISHDGKVLGFHEMLGYSPQRKRQTIKWLLPSWLQELAKGQAQLNQEDQGHRESQALHHV
jgi:hypothetical protein